MSIGFPKLRKLIHSVLSTGSSLDAFCHDHFINAHKQFASGLNSDEKITVLFQCYDEPEQIFQTLLQEHPEAVSRHHGSLLSNRKPVRPLLSANANYIDILGAALNLDRSAQWATLFEECRKEANKIFLIYGHHNQNLSFFVHRIFRRLAEDLGHNRIEVPLKINNISAKCAAEWEDHLRQELSQWLGCAEGKTSDLLSLPAAQGPLLITIGRHPLCQLTPREEEGLQDFIGQRLPILILQARRQHVRILIAVDYDSADRSLLQRVDTWARACAALSGMKYCKLPELALPTWAEVESYLRTHDPPCGDGEVESFYQVYQQLISPQRATSFHDLANAIDRYLRT